MHGVTFHFTLFIHSDAIKIGIKCHKKLIWSTLSSIINFNTSLQKSTLLVQFSGAILKPDLLQPDSVHHLKLRLEFGSEYQTCLLFKWSNRGWMSNGLVFECHLNTGQPDHLNARQMDAILFSYVLVQYLNGRSST